MSDTPSTAQVPASQTIVLQQPRESLFGRFGKLLFIPIGLLVVALIGLTAQYKEYFNPPHGPQEKYHSLNKTASDKIAMVDISGAIMEGDDYIKEQLDRIREDDRVKAVVLRINSPGGTVTYSDYLLHHLRELKDDRNLPMVVSMGSLCASGGYYVAMAVGDTENAIFAEPTTWTGSIGVVIPTYSFANSMAAWGVKDNSIASGPLKTMGSPTQPMTSEEKEVFEALVGDAFEDFKAVVKSGRPKLADDEDALDAVTTGQIFSADQAMALGLVDEIGFEESAIKRAAQLAGLAPEKVRAVKYERPPSPFGQLFAENDTKPTAASNSLRGLIELTTPRAYYLWSLAPTLIETRR